MYEQHFGLTKRPFPAPAATADVFVGPQAAAVIAALEKGLSSEDAVVAVSGPAGVGKTTVVRRALDAVGDDRIVVSVGRLQLGHDEVIELLMAGLGARQLPKSSVHRFAAFRRLLQQYAERHKRVLIVVEDATRVGIDALSELEALTAEDAGVSNGASIVLMGDNGLGDLLREPRLARLRQRVRARKSLEPMHANEMRGYLKHCLRVAGGDFDSLFAGGAVELLRELSEGTARVANNLVKSTLRAAAEAKQQQVTLELIERIADEEFGLTITHDIAALEDDRDRTATAPTPAEPEVIAANPAFKGLAETSAMEEIEAAAEPEPEMLEKVQPPASDAPEPVEEMLAAADPEPEPIKELLAAVDPEPEPSEELLAAVDPEPELIHSIEAAVDPDPQPAAEMRAVTAATPETGEQASVVAALGPIERTDASATGIAVEPIEDTLPDLEVLAPELAQATLAALDTGETSAFGPDGNAAPDADAADTMTELPILTQPPPEDDKAEEDVPTLFTATATDLPAEPTAAADEGQVPAWDRDPTLAELKPDLDALERAMALAHGSSEADTAQSGPDQPEAQDVSAEEPEAQQPEAEVPSEDAAPIIPEITLDRQIQEKIDEATEALRQTQTDVIFETADGAAAALGTPTPGKADKASNDSGKDTAELRQIAAGLARAKSLDDVDDNLAETLFGEEFSVIAAAVLAKAKEDPPANDELELQLEQTQSGMAAPAADIEGAADVAKSRPSRTASTGVDGSPSQRLATVRALNASTAPAGTPPTLKGTEDIVMAMERHADLPPSSAEQPTSIEDQIETSMTATLKALSIRADSSAEDDADAERKKGGFLSRFRRS